MSRLNEADSNRNRGQEGADLGRKYRPIGIGAVAAAFSVTGRRPATDMAEHPAGHLADMNERGGNEDGHLRQVPKAA